MMWDEGHQKLEVAVVGRGRAIFTVDTEIKYNPGSRAPESEVIEYCESRGLLKSDGQWLFAKWEANKWTNNNVPIKDWKKTIVQWALQGDIFPSQRRASKPQRTSERRSTAMTPEQREHAAAEQAQKMKTSLGEQWKR
jgi:hypothetical protein